MNGNRKRDRQREKEIDPVLFTPEYTMMAFATRTTAYSKRNGRKKISYLCHRSEKRRPYICDDILH